MRHTYRPRVSVAALGITLCLAAAAPARAQTFISPLLGYNFGGDTACVAVTGCEDKRLNAGVALGRMGNILGFEEEFSYTKNFFGDAPSLTSNVLTVMTNVMLVPNVGPVRPYVVAGLGLVKSHVELTPSSVLTRNNSSFGWDAGGGLMILFSKHAGVRGDIRYFHAFKDFEFLGIGDEDAKLDFGRASGGLVFTF